MREEILLALQSSLDPLAAKAAIDALDPVLETVSPPPLLRRRRRPRVLAPVPGEGAGGGGSDLRTSARFRLEGSASLRSQSEPTPLTVRKKQIAGRAAVQSPLPPLSVPVLRQRSGKSGYDTESVIGVLRLVRRQGEQVSPPPLSQSPARPRVLDKPARIAELRQRFARNRSAITDTLADDDDDVMVEEAEDSSAADLALVAKYFPSSVRLPPALDVSTPAAPIALSAGSDDDAVREDVVLSPMTPGIEGLLRWSSSLDIQELL